MDILLIVGIHIAGLATMSGAWCAMQCPWLARNLPE